SERPQAPRSRSEDSAGLCDVAGLRALWAVNDLELDRLALLEGWDPVALDRREVDEHVTAAVTFDETVTLGVVEPLDLTCDTHRTFPALQWRGAWRRMTPPALLSPRQQHGGHKKRPRVRGLGLRRWPAQRPGDLTRSVTGMSRESVVCAHY